MNPRLTPRWLIVLLVTSMVVIAPTSLSDGCCMAPESWQGQLGQKAQRGLILHRDGIQDLLLKIKPFFNGEEGAPPYMAWVITVPSRPLNYAAKEVGPIEEASAVSDRVQRLAEWQWARRSRFDLTFLEKMFRGARDETASGVALHTSNAHGLEIGTTRTVGPYTITPVHANNAHGVDALQNYLKENEFPAEDPEELRWFAARDFTFLCVRVQPPPNVTALAAEPELPPLAIRFQSDAPYYPAKYSARQGDFRLELILCTDRPLHRSALESNHTKLRARRSEFRNPWISAAGMKDVKTGLDALDEPGRWYVNRINSSGFNRQREDGSFPIHDWKDDVFFSLGTDDDAIGSWYYGDTKISRVNLLWREDRYAIAVWALLAFVLVRFVRRRRQARVTAP